MSDLCIVEARSVDELSEHRAAWDELAECTVEPNVFYQSTFLIPAWECLRRDSEICVVLMYAGDVNSRDSRGPLVGFFPLHMTRAWGVPLRAARFWKHTQCFLCAPLLRCGYEVNAFAALLGWLRQSPKRPKILEVGTVFGDGPVSIALTELLRAERLPWFTRDVYTRAVHTTKTSPGADLPASILPSRLKRFRRLERNLAELGRVEFETLGPETDRDTWLAQFLRLESSGWKREQGTALDCNPNERAFFLVAARNAHSQGKLHGLALLLNGNPIAMICDFRQGRVIFGYKAAYDEAYAAYSPGALLEIENLRRIACDPSVERFDSCSDAASAALKSLLPDRRAIVELAIGIGRAPGDLAVALMPLFRWGKKSLKALAHRIRILPARRKPAGADLDPTEKEGPEVARRLFLAERQSKSAMSESEGE